MVTAERVQDVRRRRRSLPVYLTLPEYHRLLAACANERDRLLIELLAHSGGRISEVLSACVGDLTDRGLRLRNLKQGIYVPADDPETPGGRWTERNGRIVHLHHVQVDEEKFIPFDPGYLASLKARLAGLSLDTPLVGRLSDGKRLGRTMAYYVVKRTAARAGILKRRFGDEMPRAAWPHCLRHSFCTWLVEAGVPLPAVGQLAGHHSPASTAVYAKIAGPELADYVRRVQF